jgi:hypothetical protein
VVWEQTALSGTVETGLRRLIGRAFIGPTIAERKYDRMTLAASHGYTDSLSAQYTGKVVLAAVEELCAANDYCFKVTVRADRKLVVDFYKGTDRTASQAVNPRVIFSDAFDSLTGINYTRSKTAYKNVALVAGEGEGTARRRCVVGDTQVAGLHRREMFVDARDVSSNDGEISEAEYQAQLSARGDTALAGACVVESMEGTVQHTTQYVYGVDYFLGDRVTIIDKYGIQADVQVLEVVQVWDENGYSCTPTFG